mgnify:CR=1 FL=1
MRHGLKATLRPSACSWNSIAAAIAFLDGKTPEQTHTYNNNVIEVPAKPSAVVTVTKDNVKAAIVDSGYYPASDFTGLE